MAAGTGNAAGRGTAHPAPAPDPTPVVALTIAGSDPSGGAGIQADLKTFHALGVYGTACLTALTSQNTVGVRGVHAVPPEVVASQIRSVLEDVSVQAIKIGMLGDAGIIRAVAALLQERRAQEPTEPCVVVLDPVMVATSGDPLLSADADEALRTDLLPVADLITPNLPEAARLLGVPEAQDLSQMRAQAAALLERGPRAVLVKGGHALDAAEAGLPGDGLPQAVDVLAIAGGPGSENPTVHEFAAPRVNTRHTHGTGCTLSSAIAAHAARTIREGRMGVENRAAQGRGRAEGAVEGERPTSGPALGAPALDHPALDDVGLVAAVRSGKEFLTRALRDGAAWRISRTPEDGHGPVNHLSQTLR